MIPLFSITETILKIHCVLRNCLHSEHRASLLDHSLGTQKTVLLGIGIIRLPPRYTLFLEYDYQSVAMICLRA